MIGGLALAGVARGVRHGYRRAWLAALVILLVSIDRLGIEWGWQGTGIAALAGLWLIFEHRHFRVSPAGMRRSSAGPSCPAWRSITLATVIDTAYIGARETRDFVIAAITATVLLVLATALPGREHRRTGEERAKAFERARAIIGTYGGDTLDYFALRDDKSWLFSGNTLIAYSVINRVMLVSPDPIGPVNERSTPGPTRWTWRTATAGTSASWAPPPPGCRSTRPPG